MTATNMCYNFVGFRYSPALIKVMEMITTMLLMCLQATHYIPELTKSV